MLFRNRQINQHFDDFEQVSVKGISEVLKILLKISRLRNFLIVDLDFEKMCFDRFHGFAICNMYAELNKIIIILFKFPRMNTNQMP